MTAREAQLAFWWRDDDVGRYDPSLDQLLALAGNVAIRPALAVVPAWLDEPTIERLGNARVDVLQHGWAHRNHAPSGRKAIELGGEISPEACWAELRNGAALLQGTLPAGFLPVLVPPWNRIDDRVTAGLRAHGFEGLSTFADDAQGRLYGLTQINTHLDVIDWRGDRRMKPLDALLGELAALLAQPPLRAIGVLTHHLLMGAAEFDRLSTFFSHVASHRSVEWLSARALFSPD